MNEDKYFVIASDPNDLGGSNYYFISLQDNEESFERLKGIEQKYVKVYQKVYLESEVKLFLDILLCNEKIDNYPFLYKKIILTLPKCKEMIREELYQKTIEDFILDHSK